MYMTVYRIQRDFAYFGSISNWWNATKETDRLTKRKVLRKQTWLGNVRYILVVSIFNEVYISYERGWSGLESIKIHCFLERLPSLL